MINPDEISGIIVHGKEWWDKAAGVTYSSVRCTIWFITGEEPEYSCSTYEANEHKQMAEEALEKDGYLVGLELYPNGCREGLISWANRNQVPLYTVVEKNCKQKEVKRWGEWCLVMKEERG